MKRNISISLLCGIVISSGSSLRAVEPTFALKNKSADAIYLIIKQNNKAVTDFQRVDKGSDFTFDLDINKPTFLEIHVCPNIGQCYLNDHTTLLATIKAGKTMYLKFDGKTLTPQKGNAKMGKTTQGYSTKNNVTRHDIKVTKGTTKGGNDDIGRVFRRTKAQ